MNQNLIPGNIMKMLGPQAKKTNQEVIIDYLITESGHVVLNAEQEKLLERWTYADDMMRSNRYKTNEVIRMLEKKFDIKRATACRDMEAMQVVFGTTRRINKNYLMSLHIDRILDVIQVCQTQGKLELLPKMFDAYTRACVSLPDDKMQIPRATAILFSLSTANISELVSVLSPEHLGKEAARLLKERGIEDIDFTEVDA